ncbi:hypothetical protein F7Q99_08230 [Streptomyces kaniharaensis]|uniref:Uncharacterized protein n=1 Tax=Streptomyces kaniharaensis TaxID=212423 RepID=A0A6N7KNY3_9ACTN|nr:hypothetical protein [Streptomyces kaniharaensis]MQS12279.1 hypothetical protein [Streptomyces kaniharaensis]
MSGSDKFEDDLLYAMTRTGEGFHAGQGDLVAGGLDRGRRRWRRRSAAAVVSGAAALALIGTGAVYLSGSTGASAAGTATVAAAPTTTAAGTATAAATPTAAQSSAPTVITGDEVLAIFRALLPKGQVTEAKGRGTNDAQFNGTFADAGLVFDDGQGKSLMSISIQKHRPKNVQPRTCSADFTLTRTDSCAVTTLPDGSKLMLSQGYEYSDHRADTKEWFATLARPDGGEISLSEWNSAQEKGAPDSRPNPPLTLDQMKAIVTDKSWDRVVAAVKYDGIDTDAIDPGLSLEEREAILAKLLPSGVTVTGRSSRELQATFQLAQGGTAGSLVLRVENWAKSPDTPVARAFKDATVLPDGSKVVMRGPGTDSPKSPQVVDVLRPDGVEVVVGEGPTGKPLLTFDQLKAIAISPEWKVKK